MCTFFHGGCMKNKFTLDIETLAKPEISGYNCVIPNYAFVKIPEVLTHELEWMYVQLSVQDQLDVNLVIDASTLLFWSDCQNDYNDAYNQMIKSYTEPTKIIRSNSSFNTWMNTNNNIPLAINTFLTTNGTYELSEVEVFGNGCNFDCSILQANHLKLFGNGDLWHYASPQNARTLKGLLNSEAREEMDELVAIHLTAFRDVVNNWYDDIEPLELHNPLYDAAREALQMSYCLSKLQMS